LKLRNKILVGVVKRGEKMRYHMNSKQTSKEKGEKGEGSKVEI
jgi:hypothetical protein